MKGFEPYPQYKDSGVEWLGEVPESWITGRLKHLLTIRGGQDHKQVESEEQTPIPVIGSGGQFSYAVKPLYEGESVLLGRKGTIDKPLYVTGRFWTVDTMFYSEIHQHADGKFAYYAATTIPFGLYSTNTALPSMSQFDLSNHLIVFPGKSDQSQIARFLDHETGKIDGLIAEQEKLIELLKEKRQATISHAVTKGLNPDAPMKDSGVEWLGEVPEHWCVGVQKHGIAFIESGTSVNAADYPASNEELGVLKTSCVYTGSFDWHENKTVNEEDLQRVTCPLAVGTLIVSRMNTPELVGAAGFVKEAPQNIFLPDRLWQVHFDENYSTEFMYWFSLSRAYREQIKIACSGTSSSMQNLAQDDFKNIKISFPPRDEQNQIVKYLDRETAKLDALLTEAQRGIDLLKERRSALISAVVTGKIDVRNWKPQGDAA